MGRYEVENIRGHSANGKPCKRQHVVGGRLTHGPRPVLARKSKNLRKGTHSNPGIQRKVNDQGNKFHTHSTPRLREQE